MYAERQSPSPDSWLRSCGQLWSQGRASCPHWCQHFCPALWSLKKRAVGPTERVAMPLPFSLDCLRISWLPQAPFGSVQPGMEQRDYEGITCPFFSHPSPWHRAKAPPHPHHLLLGVTDPHPHKADSHEAPSNFHRPGSSSVKTLTRRCLQSCNTDFFSSDFCFLRNILHTFQETPLG